MFSKIKEIAVDLRQIHQSISCGSLEPHPSLRHQRFDTTVSFKDTSSSALLSVFAVPSFS